MSDHPESSIYSAPRHGWTCFHCGETFTTPGSAADHFGVTPESTTGCLIDRVALEEGGKPERGRGLLMELRKVQATATANKEEIERLQTELAALREENQKLREALDESVKLQSHYAVLLNEYDGGKRQHFVNSGAWIRRLDELKARAAAERRREAF
jgi:hypothetical protein